jgi:hypothetical protein
VGKLLPVGGVIPGPGENWLFSQETFARKEVAVHWGTVAVRIPTRPPEVTGGGAAATQAKHNAAVKAAQRRRAYRMIKVLPQ